MHSPYPVQCNKGTENVKTIGYLSSKYIYPFYFFEKEF